jgi:hypothetical protein
LAQRQWGRFVAVGAPLEAPQRALRDVVASATFRQLAGGPGGSYGLIVRDAGPGPRDGVRQTGRYYVLQVNDLGGVSIWRRDYDHWVERLPWSSSPAVRRDGPNELQVQAWGPELIFAVNGVQVARLTDTFLREGAVGLFVGGNGTEVAVERFTVQVPGLAAEGVSGTQGMPGTPSTSGAQGATSSAAEGTPADTTADVAGRTVEQEHEGETPQAPSSTVGIDESSDMLEPEHALPGTEEPVDEVSEETSEGPSRELPEGEPEGEPEG